MYNGPWANYGKNNLEAVTDGSYKLVFPHKYVTYGAYETGRTAGTADQPGNTKARTV